MLVKLTEVCGGNNITPRNPLSLREVFINPEHVVLVREEIRTRQLNEQGMVGGGLEANHRFSKLTINRGNHGTEIVVVGAPQTVETTLNLKKQLLKG